MTAKKNNAAGVIKDIKQQTWKLFCSEEKIKILIERMRGEDAVASLCNKYGINDNLYYKWSKDLLEAGKKRLNSDTGRSANTAEVERLRRENDNLKEVLVYLYLRNELLKKV